MREIWAKRVFPVISVVVSASLPNVMKNAPWNHKRNCRNMHTHTKKETEENEYIILFCLDECVRCSNWTPCKCSICWMKKKHQFEIKADIIWAHILMRNNLKTSIEITFDVLSTKKISPLSTVSLHNYHASTLCHFFFHFLCILFKRCAHRWVQFRLGSVSLRLLRPDNQFPMRIEIHYID